MTVREFFASAIPMAVCGSRFPDVGDDGYLYEGLVVSAFSTLFGMQPNQVEPSKISIAKYLRELGLTEWPDQRFCLLIERLVHPEIQLAKNQNTLVERFNEFLQQDDFELRAEGLQGGLAVYKVRKRITGVSGTPKYIIFASVGPKPDIVIDDAMNIDIRIVRHADQCLIYDQPPPVGDLTWAMLVEWWSKLIGTTGNNAEIRHNLGKRLKASLQSEAERFFFATYFKVFKPTFGDNLPALLPQVYLHYDPRSRSERSKPALVRQRMDFLILLRNAARIVIEIDGIQHYSDEDGRASPSCYAEMVAEDRRIRNLGYEVYRFGGAEIVIWDGGKFKPRNSADKTIISFFQELFIRHGIRPELEN